MATTIFTKEFYSKMYDELLGSAKYLWGDRLEDAMDGKAVAEDCYVGELYITVDEVYYDKEWVDESFDHAFGTWHDPNAGYEICGIEYIDKVHVYESDDNDAPEIQGFDKEAFFEANK